MIAKTSRGGYDGKGVWVVRDLDEAREVLRSGVRLLAEHDAAAAAATEADAAEAAALTAMAEAMRLQGEAARAEAVAAHLWVALKHEITYRKPTFLDDDVIATVLLEKVQGARAFYETVIRRGEEVLAEVKSSWCCLDAQTLRPARLATSVIERFFPKD